MTSSSTPIAPPIARQIMAMPAMKEWIEGAKAEPDEVVELDVEF